MKKFKIKNRPKRKYVKKNELAASLSQTQSLTLGIIPMLLMAIAFFATFLISNPQIATNAVADIHLSQPSLPSLPAMPTITIPKITLPSVALPEFSMPQISLPTISLPHINLTFELPQMPTMSLPTFTLPTISLPTFAFPNIAAMVGEGISATLTTVDTTIDASMQEISKTAQQIDSAVVSVVTTTGQQTSITIAVVSESVTQGTNYLMQLTKYSIHILSLWMTAVAAATVDGWNGFVWFIGTPFRYIAHATDEIIVACTPLINFLTKSLNNAVDQLQTGGNTLIQGTNYATSSMTAGK